MRRKANMILVALLVVGCASKQASPLAGYETVDPVTILPAPGAEPGRYHPEDRDTIDRGRYLVELLGCGVCHTNGALEGAAQAGMALAGSDIGIAYSNPLGDEFLGVVYPPNITPDEDTGIGAWSDNRIGKAIRAGVGGHGGRIATMPWQAYAKLSDDDLDAIVLYLRSITPVAHRTPKPVAPGNRAQAPYVYFGVYRHRH